MDLFFNECSLHGQFSDLHAFINALDNLMKIRRVAKKYNRELYCHRNCQNTKVTYHHTLPQAIGLMDKSKARVIMSWFGQTGPFWDDGRKHSSDEFFECRGEVVTDTAIGECAFLRLSNRPAQLITLIPSNWVGSPLEVTWFDGERELSVELINHVSEDTLELELQGAVSMPQSWDQFARDCPTRFPNLHFSREAFKPLKGKPFVVSAVKGLIDLLNVLSDFKAAHEPGAGRTQAGHELYQKFFTGQHAWFTDSSDTEKADFKKEMTFFHPEKSGEELFATFHGKVKTPQMRIHFNWPIVAEAPLYILYIGDKITKY